VNINTFLIKTQRGQKEVEKHFSVPEMNDCQEEGKMPALTNGLRKCGIYTQWNFMQP
jgi:hypothetical protein